MERKETKGRGKEATKQESKGKRRKGKDRDGKERKNERQGKGRKGQKRNGKERKWRESKGKEQKGKSRKGASERSLFVAGLAEWVGMHGLHKPFPLGGAPAKGQSRCAVDREQSTVEMLSCNKLYPGKCMRPGQDEVIKDPRRRGLFHLWLARTPAGKGQERKRT